MMIERRIEAGVPFRWVAADSVYGVGDVERTLRQAGIGYIPGVKDNHWLQEKQKILPQIFQSRLGTVCRREVARRESGSMTGRISLLLTWMLKNLAAPKSGYGRVAY